MGGIGSFNMLCSYFFSHQCLSEFSNPKRLAPTQIPERGLGCVGIATVLVDAKNWDKKNLYRADTPLTFYLLRMVSHQRGEKKGGKSNTRVNTHNQWGNSSV